ncbi:MAG: anti-sigma factor antagonist [Thermoleophilaceae bacterium]|nr:anti-sigma factor antagonist [Thermoleophilaceae bacterium]
MKTFEVTSEDRGSAVHMRLSGELDISSATKVEDELARVEPGRPDVIVLDLRGLDFMDSTGLRLLIAADARAREEGRRLTIVKGPEPVQRVFRITRLEERLELVDDAPAA